MSAPADPLLEALRADDAPPRAVAAAPHVALQRVVVRMLFDPAFVERVYADPARALDGLGIPAVLRDQLVGNDRRLWSADRLRRTRALKILMEEFKTSCGYSLLATGRIAFLDAFFGSPEFHAAVQSRSYLALAFADYLAAALRAGTVRCERLAAVLRLESAMARSRRLAREAKRFRHEVAPLDAETVAAAPGVVAVSVPGGTIAAVQAMEAALFEASLAPALAWCSDAPRPDKLPAIDAAHPEAFVCEPGPAGKVGLHGIPDAYRAFLDACAAPVARRELHARLRERRIAAGDARAMEESLRDAGLLRAAGPRG